MDELNGVSERFQSHPDAAEVGQAGIVMPVASWSH